MSTTTELPTEVQVDAALDEIQQARAEAMAQQPSVQRSQRLAELADIEAAWWEQLSERTETRVYWRAALVAREHAKQAAHYWLHHVAVQRASDPRALAGVS